MPTHRLDDLAFVTRRDPSGMYDFARRFPEQCARAVELSNAQLPHFEGEPPRLVVLTGLGGSAAGGDLVRALCDVCGNVPFVVNRDYSLPGWVGREACVVACSYSGNTEETISAYEDAGRRGARRFVVTSGGELAARSARDGTPAIVIPGGQPPRTALGYLFFPVLALCQSWGVLPEQDAQAAVRVLERCVSDWGVETPFDENPAKLIASELHGGVGLFYGVGSWQAAVAYRWKGQVCENAKNLAFTNSFPELNHNEILGWVASQGQGRIRWRVVLLEDGLESPKMAARARVTQSLIEPAAKVLRAKAQGSSLLERMLSLVTMGDFVSLYLAALNGVDPASIDWIDRLKAELAKVPAS